MVSVENFNYYLPKKLIGQKPIRPRDHSRLMVLKRREQKIVHDYFYNLDKYLRPGDMLVANNSKVIPARLLGKKETGGKIEILLIKPLGSAKWEALVKGKSKSGLNIIFNKNFKGQLIQSVNSNSWQIKFNLIGEKLNQAINKFGVAPTPPYIKPLSNLKEYQTIYAKHPGSIAAPTAGFHFTPRLIKKLKKQDLDLEFITLHVGLGTFQPVKVREIQKHKMHSEIAEIKPRVAYKLNKIKTNKQRIIAIGTTSARTLEAFCLNKNKLEFGTKSIELFIYPPYQFKFIDGMITNFHLPKSTLLMLVCAFANRDFIFQAYHEAIKNKYRFYSFGDAMLII